MFVNLYQRPGTSGAPQDAEHEQEHYEDFYEDVFEELSQFGELVNLGVCDNLGHHLAGNVYAQYREEEQAQAALKGMQGRFYEGRPVIGELSPVTDFQGSTCRQFECGNCPRGGQCNFMHIKAVSRATRKVLWGRYPGRRDNAYLEELASMGNGGARGYGGRGGGGGYDRRGGFGDRPRGGYYESRRGGYDDRRRGGYDEGRRGGYDEGRRGGYEEGRRGGYDDRRGGYEGRGDGHYGGGGGGGGGGQETDEERRARIAAWNTE